MSVRFIRMVAIVGTVAAAPALGQAQSSQDLLRALTPPSGGGGVSRGIRPAPPASDTAPSAGPSGASQAGAPPSGAHAGAGGSHGRATAAAGRPAPAESGAGEVNIYVEFRTGSAQLTPAARRILDSLGGALTNSRLSGYRFRIEGHTDTVGTPEGNKTLSEQRAEAVVAYLTEKFHIDRSKLDAVGLGESDLLVPTPPQTPEARNRRVRVVNLGA